MDLIVPALLPYLLRALAGAAGGAVRWASTGSSWQQGLGHIFAGATAGTFLGPMVFSVIKPLADFSGMDPLDGQLLGANLAGTIGISLYAVPTDFLKAWVRSKASTPEEPKP
jgi:hypothetical protein